MSLRFQYLLKEQLLPFKRSLDGVAFFGVFYIPRVLSWLIFILIPVSDDNLRNNKISIPDYSRDASRE
jgi:hypothetical protein